MNDHNKQLQAYTALGAVTGRLVDDALEQSLKDAARIFCAVDFAKPGEARTAVSVLTREKVMQARQRLESVADVFVTDWPALEGRAAHAIMYDAPFVELPPRYKQVRFPRSKKKRIRKKWAKNPANYGFVEDKAMYVFNGRIHASSERVKRLQAEIKAS